MINIIADPYDEFPEFENIEDGSWDSDADKLRYLAGYFDMKDAALGITDRAVQEDLERIAGWIESQAGGDYVSVGVVTAGKSRMPWKRFAKKNFNRHMYMRKRDL